MIEKFYVVVVRWWTGGSVVSCKGDLLDLGFFELQTKERFFFA